MKAFRLLEVSKEELFEMIKEKMSNMEMRSITRHQSEKVFESYIRVGLFE